MHRTLTIVTALGLFAGLLTAQDSRPMGTQPGQVLPGPFRALVVFNPDAPKGPEGVVSEDRANLGDHARLGKFHDPITRYGVDPTVAIFSRELPQNDSALAKLVQTLDQEVGKHRNDRLHSFVTFLTLKGDFTQDVAQPLQIKQIREFGENLQLKHTPLLLDRTESERTKAYNISADTTVLVLVYVNQTVQARFSFTADKPLDDAGVQSILAAAKKLIDTGK